MACNYRYISRWVIKPRAHPAASAGKFQVYSVAEDARSEQGALDKFYDLYPQYRDMPLDIECVIPARTDRNRS